MASQSARSTERPLTTSVAIVTASAVTICGILFGAFGETSTGWISRLVSDPSLPNHSLTFLGWALATVAAVQLILLLTSIGRHLRSRSARSQPVSSPSSTEDDGASPAAIAAGEKLRVVQESLYAFEQTLEDTRMEVLRRLVNAAEFRDNETGAHIQRMSLYAHHLAVTCGLGKRQCDMIRNAAPLHDIGKIGIPDAILLKAGKLTPDERVLMNRHAEIGGEILAGSGHELIEMARTIALTHHEKWDGTGYPENLSGEETPIAGRIVAIADVFDALTTTRPYKTAWSIDAAMAFLQEKAGSHFDPLLVPLFIRELPALLEIKARFRDDDPHGDGVGSWLHQISVTLPAKENVA